VAGDPRGIRTGVATRSDHLTGTYAAGVDVAADGADQRTVTTVRREVRVRGVVQGVGFRPFVYALATELGLSGGVRNDSEGVLAEVQGSEAEVEAFCRRVATDAPPLAAVEQVGWTPLPPRPVSGFVITASASGAGRTLVPADVATCPDCLAELRDPGDRRFRHPFITCTNCGPRFTIVTGLPYDRPMTTMRDFPLCPDCAREYADPTDRRFHAQPVSCHACGPVLELVESPGPGPGPGPGPEAEAGPGAGAGVTTAPVRREEALARARQLLADGRIVAVKGIGGYHLACNATDPLAVQRLRDRKQRGDKPFAVLVPDLATAREIAHVGDAEAALLTSARAPVVLIRRRNPETAADRGSTGLRVAEQVAPGNPDLGVMLPPTALHHLLLGLPTDRSVLPGEVSVLPGEVDGPPTVLPGEAPRPRTDRPRTDRRGPRVLVLTSGNLASEPIVTDDAQALTRLAGIADAWLRHDRPIHVPCDDSVVRVVDGLELPVRRSRGYAPLPVALPVEVEPALAVGGDLKNTFCVAQGRYAWLSAHVGDMDDLATQEAFERSVQHLTALVDVRPGLLVADRHPGYRSAAWAVRTAAAEGLPVRRVQHHHAHVAAVMAEHGLDGGRPVIGIAFDGTGYGDDGAVWGGEVLLADYDGFERLAHLSYVPLAGGDTTVHRPYRMALAHLDAAGVPWDEGLPCVDACPPDERRILAHQLRTGLASVPTSSAGRLFDAVASLAGVCHRVDFEAQAAMALEAAALGVLRSGLGGSGLGGSGPGESDLGGSGPGESDLGGSGPGESDLGGVRSRDSGAGSTGGWPTGACEGAVSGGWGAYPLPLVPSPEEGPGVLVWDCGGLVRAVARDVRAGVPAGVVAARFHRGLAAAVVAVAVEARRRTGQDMVALSGGVFCNGILLGLTARWLARAGFVVLRHRRVPPNDGGLGLGQVVVGARRRARGRG
jgi:hydrogenase maturation protein HypF